MTCVPYKRMYCEEHVALIVIDGTPVGKPRMTRRDRWARRACVLRYWAWCDLARRAAYPQSANAKRRLTIPTSVAVAAYFSHPTRQGPHCMKPDSDNILKAVCDALFENDEMVYQQSITKLWTDKQSHIVITIGETREWRT